LLSPTSFGNWKIRSVAKQDGRSIGVQVNAAGTKYGWPLASDKPKIVDNVLCVFVGFRGSPSECGGDPRSTPKGAGTMPRQLNYRASVHVTESGQANEAPNFGSSF